MLELTQLLNTPESDRNFTWDEKFFKFFSEANVKLMSSDPQQGPDGWPYLICETLPNLNHSSVIGDTSEIESVQKLLHWLAQKGIGLVVNPRRQPYPDYVFSYGMIWSFRETGYFLRPDLVQKQESNQVQYESTQIKTGTPTNEFLPLYVRKVLKDFFRDQNVFNPKILMVSADGQNYDLCFSLESLGNPIEKEHAGIAEAIAWFLPTHYSIVLISEKGLPQFLEL